MPTLPLWIPGWGQTGLGRPHRGPHHPHPHLMSSSLAKMMTPLALEVSRRRRTILSNSPGLGSRGIFTDWAMHTPPAGRGGQPGADRGAPVSLPFTLKCMLLPAERSWELPKVPPFTSWVGLDMSLKFSVPRFPHY